ncbi:MULTISPECIES: MnhB domain-containing protein [Actinopolyspora]|uniref:Multisubunit Na+/H+ antiporter, MnhB subunit n=1 Tax=Actinopolyspora saharensis TaxID=995062 RepID=A0A1H0YWD0_9ACTN|nr:MULTISPECIES: MnhB domain-containing protein [Actinopolyspora]NHD19365.1 hypothetical protein [Actinopolyspora sp. BKK2]NHE78562.1 hypothetical protein [Actinopolyspora sp. BKK1]SDQ19463.1 Multisubunit Na+/H+ antiporter, MnhB subunit [Actinopolyspora saharensis]
MNTLISRIAARVVTPLAVVLGVLLYLRGHFTLGGGFLAAVVIGIAAVFRHITIGAKSVERLLDRGTGDVVGAGVLLMVLYGFAGYLWGGGFFASAELHLRLPALGEVTVPSTLLFELGIALTVVGIVVAVIHELGGER